MKSCVVELEVGVENIHQNGESLNRLIWNSRLFNISKVLKKIQDYSIWFIISNFLEQCLALIMQI